MTLSQHINRFNRSLKFEAGLPDGIEVMNPFINPVTASLSEAFYDRFYADNNPRKLILGINPGRLGGGITGIPFTDPVKLQEKCGIENNLKKVTEPSAGFIHDMIEAFGGVRLFYSGYFIHAVCPLGFLKEGLNYNYYDSKPLEKAATPFIVSSMKRLLEFPFDTRTCYCLGNGRNFYFLSELNRREKLFGKVIPLPHPRWIVQYRRKRYREFIGLYLDALQ